VQEEDKQNLLWGLFGITLGGGIPMLIPSERIVGFILIGIAVIILSYLLYSRRKETKLKSIKDAIKDSKCVWAFVYTGGQILDANVVKKGEPTSIKKIILLKPDLNNDAFNYITELSGNDTPTKREKEIQIIRSLLESVKSVSTKVKTYYHSEKLAYTFMIYDKTPKIEGAIELPKSKNAWIVVQPLEPKRATEKKDWRKWVVKNEGKTKEQFEAYYNLFTKIESEAEPS
jgi:hypothetical protein